MEQWEKCVWPNESPWKQGTLGLIWKVTGEQDGCPALAVLKKAVEKSEAIKELKRECEMMKSVEQARIKDAQPGARAIITAYQIDLKTPKIYYESLHESWWDAAQRLDDAERLRRAQTQVTQLCDGLEWLHRNWIAHQDLKCDNIFVGEDGNDIKIGDFGHAAKFLHPFGDEFKKVEDLDDDDIEEFQIFPVKTNTEGVMIGTHAYTSPEKADALICSANAGEPTGFDPYEDDKWAMAQAFLYFISKQYMWRWNGRTEMPRPPKGEAIAKLIPLSVPSRASFVNFVVSNYHERERPDEVTRPRDLRALALAIKQHTTGSDEWSTFYRARALSAPP